MKEQHKGNYIYADFGANRIKPQGTKRQHEK